MQIDLPPDYPLDPPVVYQMTQKEVEAWRGSSSFERPETWSMNFNMDHTVLTISRDGIATFYVDPARLLVMMRIIEDTNNKLIFEHRLKEIEAIDQVIEIIGPLGG